MSTNKVATWGQPVGFSGAVDATKFFGGLECEIEAIKTPKHFGIFQCKEDGSLRNHGFEFVSQPAERDLLVKEFTDLHKWLKFYPNEDPYSSRTSTHVHVNCLCLTEAQARDFVLYGALFEELLFAMVKPERRDNIHCVPLTETHLPSIYRQTLSQLVQQWSKYTAINLKRLPDLGTIEFRHMHGTNSVEDVSAWLKVLENMFFLCQQQPLNKKVLTDRNTILGMFDYVFEHVEKIKMLRPSLFNIIRNSLIDVKFAVI